MSGDPRTLDVVDRDFPDDPVTFFRQHGYSGRKAHLPVDEAVAIGERVWSVHDALQASLPEGTPPPVRALPWPAAALPVDLAADLRLSDLVPLARELLDGQEPHVLSWQAFARRAGERATPWHSDDIAVPIDGPCVAFWMPLTHIPTRTGLVALADLDGTGTRPVRQAELDPGDLTWHDMQVVHRAEDCPVDFLAFGIAVVGERARIDLGDWPPLRGMRGMLCRRISPDLVHRGSVVTPGTPRLAGLGGR